MRLLTTSEAADYLRLKERKLYELISEGQIPCTKVTGKWLFPRDELDRWLASSLARPEGMNAAEPMPIIGGCHDALLEWALRESGCGLAILPEGSEAGLARFRRGELVATALHLHSMEGSDADANIAAIRNKGHFFDAVLVAFARREQGLLVAPGNPLRLSGIGDVVKSRARITLRPDGVGAQFLLRAELHRAGLKIDQLNAADPVSPTGFDAAQAIRAGRADCGIATRAAANGAGLDFLAIGWEHFDLLVRQRDYFRAPIQKFLGFLRGTRFAEHAKEMGGYDIARTGGIRHAP